MIPLSKFVDILQANKEQMSSDFDEVIMAAMVVAAKPFAFTMDEQGQFYCSASGSLEDCIRALEHHLSKLKKIKEQKESKH